MEALRSKALSISGVSEFGPSKVKGKRFYVIYKGKRINFGSDTNNTFIDHGDVKKRKAWRARHSVIKLKSGEYAYQVKTQPEYYSYHLLW
jgi:hypothetical protein